MRSATAWLLRRHPVGSCPGVDPSILVLLNTLPHLAFHAIAAVAGTMLVIDIRVVWSFATWHHVGVVMQS